MEVELGQIIKFFIKVVQNPRYNNQSFSFQGSLSGLAGKFPSSYMGAVVQGQALGGIFAAASNVIMLSCGNAVTAAFADFLVAIIFTVTALIAFVVLTKTEFYQYYANETSSKNEDQSENGKT